MKLSEHDIDEICNMVKNKMDINSVYSKRAMIEYTIADLKKALEFMASGIRHGVCPHCMGAGYDTKTTQAENGES